MKGGNSDERESNKQSAAFISTHRTERRDKTEWGKRGKAGRELQPAHCSILKNQYVLVKLIVQSRNNYCKQMRSWSRWSVASIIQFVYDSASVSTLRPHIPLSLILFFCYWGSSVRCVIFYSFYVSRYYCPNILVLFALEEQRTLSVFLCVKQQS